LSPADGGFALLVMGAYVFVFVVSFLINSADNYFSYGDPPSECGGTRELGCWPNHQRCCSPVALPTPTGTLA